jgi:monoamine oxidase
MKVAIVGGGISGIYCAWRLKQDNPDSDIVLFESSNRIGGRLLSVIPPRMPNVRCELGGMRFTSLQPKIKSLVQMLGLKTRAFTGAIEENIAYLRRHHLRIRDLNNSALLPYHLTQTERCLEDFSPTTLLRFAIDQLVPGATSLTGEALETLLKDFKLDGSELYKHGFWNLLSRSISSEAYRFIFDCSGYDTIGLNWNALNTILLNFRDFGKQVDYRALVDGYEAVPRRLHEMFKHLDGDVHFAHHLRSFTKNRNTGKMDLAFRLGPEVDGDDDVEQKSKKNTVDVWADHLILAMPRRALQKIKSPLLKKIRKLIRSVTPVPLFKMFVCYPGPWWRAAEVSKGQSVTDLPLRQCYYWGVEGEQEDVGADPKNRNAVILATYDDSRYVRFWAGLRYGDKVPGYPQGRGRVPEEHAKWNAHLASRAMTAEIDRQLKEMHGLKYAPDFTTAVYKDWGKDPFGGGVNFWKVGVDSGALMKRMIHPIAGVNLYVCGEAYSENQGWVEGALETAEKVLEHFDISQPDWLQD